MRFNKTDLDLGPFEADGADNVSVHRGLRPENVLDPRPHAGFFAVGGLLRVCQRRGTRALSMYLALQAPCRQIGFPFGGAVGTVGIHWTSLGFGRPWPGIEQGIEHLTVMDLSRRDGIALDQFGRGIGIDVVFVAIVGLVILFGPAGVRVFLPALGGLLGVIPPALIVAFSARLLRWCGASTKVASIICPALAT